MELDSDIESYLRDNGVVIRGRYNDIHTKSIGKGTKISGWSYIGKGSSIGKNCILSNHMDINLNVRIMDDVSIQPFNVFVNDTFVDSGTMIGAFCTTADELYMSPKTDNIIRKPPHVGKNVIIGMCSSYCSCRIGDNSVIGANSFVKDDVPADEVWAGNPAKFIMTRDEFDKRMNKYQSNL